VLNELEQVALRRARREDVLREVRDELRLQRMSHDRADQALADRLRVNRTDARCLEIIDRLDGVTAGRLAAEAGLSSGAVTTVLDRLAGARERVESEAGVPFLPLTTIDDVYPERPDSRGQTP